MKIITPLVLFGLGVVLLVLAVVLYPSAATEAPGPAVPGLTISSSVPIFSVTYQVNRTSSDRTDVEILIRRDLSVLVPRSRKVSLFVLLFGGSLRGPQAASGHSRSGVTTFHFTIPVADFGMRFDGITASVAIPAMGYIGPGTPFEVVDYPIPSASSYDWSSLPTSDVGVSHAQWTIAATRSKLEGEARASTPGQVAIGINHARQATDSNKTFAAGALLGLAGAAILSAVQEALHARD